MNDPKPDDRSIERLMGGSAIDKAQILSDDPSAHVSHLLKLREHLMNKAAEHLKALHATDVNKCMSAVLKIDELLNFECITNLIPF